jgi:pyrroloquinoline quinone (PQQ) biosynthesis protein C
MLHLITEENSLERECDIDLYHNNKVARILDKKAFRNLGHVMFQARVVSALRKNHIQSHSVLPNIRSDVILIMLSAQRRSFSGILKLLR